MSTASSPTAGRSTSAARASPVTAAIRSNCPAPSSRAEFTRYAPSHRASFQPGWAVVLNSTPLYAADPNANGSPPTTATLRTHHARPVSPGSQPTATTNSTATIAVRNERVDGEAPRPERHRRTRLEHPQHVVEPERVAEVEHQAREVGEQQGERDRIRPRSRPAVKVAGAASSPTAATRNSPVVRLLKRTSKTTSVVPVGRLGHGPVRVAGSGGGTLAFVCMSGSPEQERGEQDRERDQPGEDRPEVVARHVEPRVERVLRQAVDRGPIDQQVERIQLGVGLRRRVAVQVRAGHARAGAAPPRACGRARAARRSGRTGSTAVGHALAHAGTRPSFCRS